MQYAKHMSPLLKNEKLLTIITVVKNDKENIQNTINSVLNQTSNEFEYLIYDGCSTDGTSRILKKIKSKKIKYIRKKDINLYDAINKSISRAQGKYITLLHSGDIYPNKNHIKKLTKILKEKKPDLVSGNIAFYKKYQKKILISRNWSYQINNFNLFTIFKIPHPSIFIKKKILIKINSYNINYRISSDLDFFLKLIKLKKLNFIYINSYFLLMKADGLSTNKKFITKKIKEDLKILFKYYSFFSIILYLYKIMIKIPNFFNLKKKIFKLNYNI